MQYPAWNPPGDGWLKCNFDGAFYPDGKGATGAVIRDHNGTFHGDRRSGMATAWMH